MTGKYIQIEGGEIFIRLPCPEKFDKTRPTVLFLHGLGESGACYAEALKWLQNVNIIIPDLPGYGHSRAAENGDHSTASQAERIIMLINNLKLEDVVLVGHSWGGDVGTLICQLGKDIISRYFCVEGDLHLDNVFISQAAARKYRTLATSEFVRWLRYDGFPQVILDWNHPAAVRYLSSVLLCDPSVFGETATEIVQKCAASDTNGVLEWGHIFARLPQPKIYCWGGRSLKKDSPVITFLNASSIENKFFAQATHWVMEDQPEAFYRFIAKHIRQRNA